jgi:hypothetical protein
MYLERRRFVPRGVVPAVDRAWGGVQRRLNWILRHLSAAPDTLAVEVVFARREQTSCELLKDSDAPVATLAGR